MRKSFIEFISESPIGDYTTLGDWTKGSSFRDKRDRALIKHPTTIARMRKKFDNTNTNFNLFFLNRKEGMKHTEVGVVTLDFVRKELGDDVAQAVSNATDFDDSINVIFTNNSGAERKPFTAWIAAHRLGHAFARKGGMSDDRGRYKAASDHLISQLALIMEDYGVQDFPNSDDKMSRDRYGSNNLRNKQLMMRNFFYHVATFKSARDKNIRDWFEVLNELIAQYLTTGKIKFNPAPKSFKTKEGTYYVKDAESAEQQVDMLSRDMELMIDDILSSLYGSILIM